MLPEDDIVRVELVGGDTLSVDESPTGISILRMKSSTGSSTWTAIEAQHVTIPYPSDGYGGGSLFLSPQERFAVFYMYSGQREERFDILKLDKDIEHVYGSDYMPGVCTNFFFDDSEETLFAVQLEFSHTGVWDEQGLWQEIFYDVMGLEPVQDNKGRQHFVLNFANILAVDLRQVTLNTTFSKVVLHPGLEYMNRMPQIPHNGQYPDLRMRLHDERLVMDMPWGPLELALPLIDKDTIDVML